MLKSLWLLIAALWLLPAVSGAVEPLREGQETFVKRAVFADNRLWLLSDAGQLFAIQEGKEGAAKESTPAPVVDICQWKGRLIAVVQADKVAVWQVLRRDEGKWTELKTVAPGNSEFLLALMCHDAQVDILTSKRLLFLLSDKPPVALSDFKGWGVTAVLAHGDGVFVGFNRGEWGGGMVRIDRLTGQVAKIDKSTGLCDGPLNSDCDPVNSIAVAPWNPDCIVVAIGLIHFNPTGQLTQVCSDDIRTFFASQYGEPSSRRNPGEDPYPSVAFYGVIPSGKDIMAVGMDGLYRVTADGKATKEKLPQFDRYGNFQVSFARPDIILVKTDINARRSVGGPVPMLVER